MSEVTDADVRALLSVLGTLLAAYGFFYTSTVQAFRDAEGPVTDLLQLDANELRKKKWALAHARGAALALAVTASILAGLFVPVAVELLSQVSPRRPYSPTNAGFLLLELFWVVLAIAMWRRLVHVLVRLRTVSRRLAAADELIPLHPESGDLGE